MPGVAGEMFVLFERVEDDRAELSPAGMRRLTAAQRVFADRHVRKIAASGRARFVNHAEIAIQENAPVPRIPQASQGRRVAIGHGVKTGRLLRRGAGVLRDAFDFRFVYGDLGVAAAICTSCTVDVLLHFAGEDLKGPVDAVVRREVTAKGEVLFHLGGSEPKYFSQVGNHVLENISGLPRRQARETLPSI